MRLKGFRNLALVIVPISIMAVSCSKTPATGKNDANVRYFKSWIHINGYDDASKYPQTPLGAYVIKDIPGTGEVIGDADNFPCLRVDFTITDLDGNVSSTSDMKLSQQIGSYSEPCYYGPQMWTRAGDYLYAGLEDVLQFKDMRVGGTRKAVIPGWLFSSKRYSSESDYLANVTGDNAIYEFTVREGIKDVEQWELDSLVRYVSRNHPTVDITDTVGKKGFYYIPIRKSVNGNAFSADTTIYINYCCRRLDGQVVDTNIADTAKVYALYKASSSYKPVLINWKTEYSNITMSSSESKVIDGFAYMLSKMGKYEKGISVFLSSYGYSYTGSGSAIPSFSPLQFEIEVVDEK